MSIRVSCSSFRMSESVHTLSEMPSNVLRTQRSEPAMSGREPVTKVYASRWYIRFCTYDVDAAPSNTKVFELKSVVTSVVPSDLTTFFFGPVRKNDGLTVVVEAPMAVMVNCLRLGYGALVSGWQSNTPEMVNAC